MMTKMMANQKRILIVEDQADIADFLRRGLNRHGFETVLSENGAQALQLLEQSHAGTEIHLIVSDIQMPVMDGIALALNVARDMPHIPIILMTGYAQQRERAHGLENLVVDILEKPFELAHLVGIINQQFDWFWGNMYLAKLLKLGVALLLGSLVACSPLISLNNSFDVNGDDVTKLANVETDKANKANPQYKSIVYDNIIKTTHKKHLAKQGGASLDKATNNKLRRIMQQLLAKNQLLDKKFTPIVIASDSVNAFSLSSQSRIAYLYVTVGLMKFVDNDDQLASVVAHEISHIQLGHHLLRTTNSAAQFNQTQELAADKYSMKLIANAGYRPSQAIILLERLDIFQAKYNVTNQADYPSNKARIKALKPIIAAL